jgi:nickel superoxide dismutase
MIVMRYVAVGLSILALMCLVTAVFWAVNVQPSQAHCQVPCGIYDDQARINRLREDAATIAKAVKNISELSGQRDAQSLNQAVRWINTKEDHATHIIDVVSEYFLTQKVKVVAPGAEGYEQYLKRLADHHAVMVAAMKTKQKAEKASVDALSHAIEALAAHY